MGIVSYQIKNKQNKVVYVMVETEAAEDVPRNAALPQIKQAAHDLREALSPISAIADAVVDVLKATRPEELMVEFGIELGGAMGIPLITKHEGKANFKVQLKWKRNSKGTKNGSNEDDE